MYLGIDVGSVSTDAVIIDNNENIVAQAIIKGSYNNKLSVSQAVEECLSKANIQARDIKGIVSTGYGRKKVDMADRSVTEISCHAKGIHYYNPDIRTLIDVGGQDSKIICIRSNGTVEDFVMNDKCSAGTGRFLEAMSNVLNISIAQMGELSIKAKKIERISSVCTVFAESEVISKLAENLPLDNIVAGIHNAITERITGMYKSVNGTGEIAMSGGVAKNKGMLYALSKMLQQPIYVPEEPQIIGALGAALISKQNLCNY